MVDWKSGASVVSLPPQNMLRKGVRDMLYYFVLSPYPLQRHDYVIK